MSNAKKERLERAMADLAEIMDEHREDLGVRDRNMLSDARRVLESLADS